MNDLSNVSDRRCMWFVGCAAVLAYACSLFGVLIYDDLHSVRDNLALRSLAEIPRFFYDTGAFSALDAHMYRPVVLTSLALDHAVGGGAAWAFKLSNTLLHALAAMALFSLLRACAVRSAAAWTAGLIFAVHPMASEAVNMISSRSDILAALGLLVGMRAYLALREAAPGRARRKAVAGLVLGATVACGSKATGVMLGPLCVVIEGTAYLRGSRTGLRAAVLRLFPVVAVTTAYLVARKLSLGVSTASLPKLTEGGDVMSGAGRDLLTQICLMAHVLPRFLMQSLVPFDLTLDPWVPLHDRWASAPVLCGWSAVFVLTVLGLRAPRRRPVVFLGTAVAWLSALPWIVLPLNLPACEHRWYLPLAGLAMIVGASLPASWSLRISRERGHPGGLLLVVLLVGGVLWSNARSLDYRDPAVVWSAVLDTHAESVHAHCGLAVACREEAAECAQSKNEGARIAALRAGVRHLDAAIAQYPAHRPALRNHVEFHLELGEHGSPWLAYVTAQRLMEANPSSPFNRLLVSRALAAIGVRTGAVERFDAAVDMALSCLEVAEPKGLVYRTAASVRTRQGDHAAALELLDESVARGLDHESVLLQRAECAMELGRRAAAARDLREVLARNPFDRRAAQLLGRAAPPR